MTILQALDGYYRRIPNVAEPGWSSEKLAWCVVLGRDGAVVDVEDLRDASGKKPITKSYIVPASFPRPGITPRAFFLWDKTAFSLGVTKASDGSAWAKAEKQHAAFRDLHAERLASRDDEGLVALRLFLENWRPEKFDEIEKFTPDMLDANIMFRLEDERKYLHERPAARALVSVKPDGEAEGGILCLISGERGPIARLHPTIKGVEGAQTAGASLVSFNLDAFTSLGKEQGANAPTSEASAFRYGAALNHLLTRGGPNRLRRRIGDATVVFWADAGEATQAAQAADDWFAALMGESLGPVDDADQAAKVRHELEALADGRPLSALRPEIVEGTRFHVLGLSPNAARLSVRFWMSDTMDVFAQRLARHYDNMRIIPPPRGWGSAPSVGRVLAKTTAFQEDYDAIPVLLAGEVMRAVLTGGSYPRSWLASVMIRLRAGDDPGSGWHAAACRAVLTREQYFRRKDPTVPEDGETPMALDREHRNIGYILGRLFAVYEFAQVAALGRGVKATMRDKYFASAAAMPVTVFPLVIAHGQNHLSKARKVAPGWATLIERELGAIMEIIQPGLPHSLPRTLRLEDQAEFAIGYYHQRSTKLSSEKGEALSLVDAETALQDEDEA
jgi:CRISPR-associated protein Csd1